ncbi:hypothetical protein [Burkholderia lata]|uniref:hypothetical protein n=1 Tax=Burkholderia lata (strain ATCC 17760 / DSM 23089 / LMG 22485 / NCIMB 9086 / R18194 / 383) TaxID=482957 RepID=UPI001454816F|nr:hypothetical protein [Burkholderia lata]VWC44293.1 hypothetical protein BLA15816_07322 [Burkholderia lata]
MESELKLDEHSNLLGKLHGNLSSLEATLRLFLSQDVRGHAAPRQGDWNRGIGEEVDETPMTDWRSLGQLIDDFNTISVRRDLGVVIDRGIVTIRDAFAHGRIMLHEGDADMRLVKFSRPVRGRVKVEFNQLLTAEWMDEQRQRARDAMFTVLNAIEAIGGKVGQPFDDS